MAVTLEQVVTALQPDEPDYDQAAKLGPEALPHLSTLVRGDDVGLAAKAASLATRIKDERSVRVLTQASEHAQPVVRISAAAELWRLGRFGIRKPILRLLGDADPQVRLFAAKSAIREPGDQEIEERLRTLAVRDPVPEIRKAARDASRRLGRVDRLRNTVRQGRRPKAD